MGIIFILCFHSFQSHSISSSENSGGGGHRTHTSTQVANSTMVANTHEDGNSKSSGATSEKGADSSAKYFYYVIYPGATRKSGTIRVGYSPGHVLVAKQYKKAV